MDGAATVEDVTASALATSRKSSKSDSNDAGKSIVQDEDNTNNIVANNDVILANGKDGVEENNVVIENKIDDSSKVPTSSSIIDNESVNEAVPTKPTQTQSPAKKQILFDEPRQAPPTSAEVKSHDNEKFSDIDEFKLMELKEVLILL